MSRAVHWRPCRGGSRAPGPRLQEAALALYDERGFDHTSVEEIAERAGLTKRTFFRHFSDKREVLFGGGAMAEEPFVAAVREAPLAAGALDAVSYGLTVLAAGFDEEGEQAARRFRIVRASPQLWERQLIKFASLAEAVERALRGRGVGDPAAILAAEFRHHRLACGVRPLGRRYQGEAPAAARRRGAR